MKNESNSLKHLVETGETNWYYNGYFLADLECLAGKKGHFGPKMCFFLGLKPLSKVQNFKKCAKFFLYIFGTSHWDIFINLE